MNRKSIDQNPVDLPEIVILLVETSATSEGPVLVTWYFDAVCMLSEPTNMKLSNVSCVL